jgi:hypothetical protein
MLRDTESGQLDLVRAALLNKDGHVIAIGRARVTGDEVEFFDERAVKIEKPAMIVFTEDEIFDVQTFKAQPKTPTGNRYLLSVTPNRGGF